MNGALRLLEEWSCETCRVRLAFVGRGLEESYSSGEITDLSGGIFTFKGVGVTVRYNTSGSTSARVIPLHDSPIPEELSSFCNSQDDVAIVFSGGPCNDMLILIRESFPAF